MIKVLERKKLNNDILVYFDPLKSKLILTVFNTKK